MTTKIMALTDAFGILTTDRVDLTSIKGKVAELEAAIDEQRSVTKILAQIRGEPEHKTYAGEATALQNSKNRSETSEGRKLIAEIAAGNGFEPRRTIAGCCAHDQTIEIGSCRPAQEL